MRDVLAGSNFLRILYWTNFVKRNWSQISGLCASSSLSPVGQRHERVIFFVKAGSRNDWAVANVFKERRATDKSVDSR